MKSNEALHDAARDGHADAIKALVDLGADVNARGVDGRTPLDSAPAYCLEDICKVWRRGATPPKKEVKK